MPSEEEDQGEMRSAEGFCLMKYASSDGAIIEWIWNSRDGVTPFHLMSRDKSCWIKHVDWNLDTRLPAEFLPPDDMRLFVDYNEIGEPTIITGAEYKARKNNVSI